MLTQYEYDTYLDRIHLGEEKTLVNTCEKASMITTHSLGMETVMITETSFGMTLI